MIVTPQAQLYFSRRSRTAWQWLAWEHRMVRPGAVPFAYAPYSRPWWYYHYYDTVPITDQTYRRLRAMYIILYGGWWCIDLDHTRYNGRKWY